MTRISDIQLENSLKLEAIVAILFSAVSPTIILNPSEKKHYLLQAPDQLPEQQAAEQETSAPAQKTPEKEEQNTTFPNEQPFAVSYPLAQQAGTTYSLASFSPMILSLYRSEIQSAIYARREDRKDVIPLGEQLFANLYELSLERIADSSERLVSALGRGGRKYIRAEENSELSILDKLLEDKGLVAIYQQADDGAVVLKEILGLDNSEYNIIVRNRATGKSYSLGKQLGTGRIENHSELEFSIQYAKGGENPDSAYANLSLLKPFITEDGRTLSHAYKVFEAKTVSQERAADTSLKTIMLTAEDGSRQSCQIQNNTALAFLYDSLVEEGFTPEIAKSSFLKDGRRMEGIYIKNISKGGKSAIRDGYHSGLLGLQQLEGGECQEALSGACAIPLDQAKLGAGERWLLTGVVQGKYDHRDTISERYIN